MKRIFPLLTALACLTPGCFGAHGIDGEEIDDPPQWTECGAALSSAAPGETCDFPDMCGETGCEDTPTRTVSCIGGTVRLVERICSPVVWFDCDEFMSSGWGTPGDYCDPTSFGACSEPLIDCCGSSYRCDDGMVAADHFCLDGCEDLPLFCEDYLPPPPHLPACRDNSECASGDPCVPPGAPIVCGACFDPVFECMVDRDCDSGEVCSIETPPCSCGGPSSVCRPTCTADSCGEGSFCNSAGACQPTSCHEGFECPANTRCFDGGPGRPGGVEEHGCQRITCAADAECDCGACVEGACHSGPGVCQPLMAIAG